MSRNGFTVALSEHRKPFFFCKYKEPRVASSERINLQISVTDRAVGAKEARYPIEPLAVLHVRTRRSVGSLVPGPCVLGTYVYSMISWYYESTMVKRGNEVRYEFGPADWRRNLVIPNRGYI